MIKQAFTKPYSDENPNARRVQSIINLKKQTDEDRYNSQVTSVSESVLEANQLEKRNEQGLKKSMNANFTRSFMAKYEVVAMTETLTEWMTDIFCESLLIDDYAKEKYRQSFHESVKNELLEIGKGDIFNTYKVLKTKSPLLETMCKICEETAVKQIDDKRAEVKEKGADVDDKVDFIINDENRSSFDQGKKEISSDDIASIVRDKVITTLSEEKERADAAQEDAAFIQQQVEELSGEEPTTESVIRGKLENPSLYKGLMVRASKMALQEGSTIDMDMVTAQAICEYTLLEMFHTMKVRELAPYQVQEMARDLYYSK